MDCRTSWIIQDYPTQNTALYVIRPMRLFQHLLTNIVFARELWFIYSNRLAFRT